eukprot:CAMPEP_0201572982 /NCGR_PEP_ID=MMETSP0190_2-20130828/16580_1 /ASSEMBLY_ACC=CAM_ASM_000263 /TAXON_ID=37353 /ORGANISM="Rosalina sp." /LENGTH=278 /DNA_ID=CAMNT_0047999415 /DNA_START=28 /DNA_END=864 /DNA_ORIENTATION=-
MGSSASKASIGASVESTGSKFTMLDYPLDQENLVKVISHLDNMDYPIIALWIVARPINWKEKSMIEHWSVIIQGQGCLLLIDFLEHNNKGAFRIVARSGTDAEFEELFKWKPPQAQQQNDNEAIEGTKYRIVASVTPSPLIPSKKFYVDYIDDEEKKKIKKLYKQQKKVKNNSNDDLKENITNDDEIKCDKRVKDIGDFLSRWTELEAQNKKGGGGGSGDNDEQKDKDQASKPKPYNAITNNCQKFALHLFEDLIGKNYADKVKFAKGQIQSPMDAKK